MVGLEGRAKEFELYRQGKAVEDFWVRKVSSEDM